MASHAHQKHPKHGAHHTDAGDARKPSSHGSHPRHTPDARTSLMITRNQDPITILLVDDDADCRMLIRDAIAECKVANRVFEVSNGHDAIQFLRREGKYRDAPRPGLIYMDIEMPVMNGLDALKVIRADENLLEIPVVMMTGLAGEQQMREAANLGANSYTLKPANAEQFLRTVLASTNYWLTIHQYPHHHWPEETCKR